MHLMFLAKVYNIIATVLDNWIETSPKIHAKKTWIFRRMKKTDGQTLIMNGIWDLYTKTPPCQPACCLTFKRKDLESGHISMYFPLHLVFIWGSKLSLTLLVSLKKCNFAKKPNLSGMILWTTFGEKENLVLKA